MTFSGIDAHDAHHRRLTLHELAERDQPLLHVAVERRADAGVAQLAIGELHARVRRVDVGAQVLGVLQRRVVARLLRAQRRLRIVERLLGHELALVQLVGAFVGLLGLHELGGAFCTSGVCSIGGRCSVSAAPYFASARASAAFCWSRLYCSFSRSSSTRTWPA